jgi:OOP family OmpA-OmpF porin
LNKDVIRVQSYAKLDNAAEIIKKLNSTVKFYVIGGTDTRASDSYNLTYLKKSKSSEELFS